MVYLQRWHGWCHMKLLPSRRVLCTPYNHAPCHFKQSHIRKVYACLAVTCHLHFWRNGRGLLRATAVTRGWNGYRNKSQHRKLTLEKKILPPLLQGFEPATFRYESGALTTELSPLRPACSQTESGRIRLSASVSVPFFRQRRQGSYCAKPTRIRSGWSGQGLAKHRIWSGSKCGSRNHRVWFLVGLATDPLPEFPTFNLGSVHPETSRIILCKTSLGPI